LTDRLASAGRSIGSDDGIRRPRPFGGNHEREGDAMKYAIGAAALVCAAAALWTSPVTACEACISGGKNEVACIETPDTGGQICTSGGGHCNEEGECGWGLMAAEGSLVPDAARLASANADARLARRDCDQAVVARWYSPESADEMRRRTAALSI
jgi:hypothetical protein